VYANELGRKYSGLKPDIAAQKAGAADLPEGDEEQVFTSSEGPIVITTRGKLVFVAESFPLDVARKLTGLILDAQGTGDLKMAGLRSIPPAREGPARPGMLGAPGPASETWEPLTDSLVRFFSNCGVMKAVVDGAVRVRR
jgi:hypothetical protein